MHLRRMLTTMAERLLSKASRAEVFALYVVTICVTAAAAAAIVHSENKQQRFSVSQAELAVSQLRACHGLNVLRVGDNRSHEDDFNFDTSLALLLRLSLAQPSTPNPRLTPKEQRHDLKLVDGFVEGLEADAKDKEWTPLVKCVPATYEPSKYPFPGPVKFAKEPPPPEALHVGRGE